MRKVISTNIGVSYTLTLQVDMGTAEGLYIMPRTTNGGNIYTGTNLAQVYVTTSGTHTVTFTASTSTTQLLVEKAGTVTQTFYIDNVKVEQSTPTLTSYPIADVVSAQHYYPYHSTMQTWEADGKEYTFGGANGQEKDFEIFKGAYTAEFWEYDSRLGKRWNVDPIVKHQESSYAAFSNNPIWFVDPLGTDTGFTSVEARKTVLEQVANNADYAKVFQELVDDKKTIYRFDQWKDSKEKENANGTKSDVNGEVSNAGKEGEKDVLVIGFTTRLPNYIPTVFPLFEETFHAKQFKMGQWGFAGQGGFGLDIGDEVDAKMWAAKSIPGASIFIDMKPFLNKSRDENIKALQKSNSYSALRSIAIDENPVNLLYNRFDKKFTKEQIMDFIDSGSVPDGMVIRTGR